jgi:hypothetical protein
MFATVGPFRRSITAIPLAFEAYVTYATTGNHLPSNPRDGSLICSTECFVFDILTSFSTPKSNIQSGPMFGGLVRRAWKETGKDAPVGRGAVADGRGRRSEGVDFGWLRLSGWPAWVLWSLAHVFYLSGLHDRFTVLPSWAWSYATFHRGSRLITGFKCARKDRARYDWANYRFSRRSGLSRTHCSMTGFDPKGTFIG